MNMIKKYAMNKIIIYSLILLLLVLFTLVPTTNNDFKVEIIDDKKEYSENVVYLLDDDNYVSRVISYFNSDNIEDNIKEKIKILINGDSSRNSFYSLIPKTTILKNVKVNKDSVYLDFSKDILNVNEYVEESMIEAIVYTLTEINGINNVYILVDGEELKELPNSKKILTYPLTRSYGINKKYDLNNFNDIDSTTIFFSKTSGDYKYYVPVTKITNLTQDKIEVIIEELKSPVNSQENLNSYMSNNTKLVSSNIDNDKMNLIFNDYIFSDSSHKVILEEVKYLLSQSIFENYNIKEVIFNTEKEKNIDRVVKKQY